MKQLYFITAQEVKDHTDAQQNMDAQYFEPRIARCQQDFIRPVLGDALYEELADAFAAEQQEVPVPMPEHLDRLHEQLVPVQAQWVLLKSLPHLVIKATNKGLKVGELELSDSQYRHYRDALKEEAQSRTGDLQAWLEANKADYPNYKAAARHTRPIGGIVL